jgi:hypothetical protein
MPGLAPMVDDPATYSRSRLMVSRPRVPEDMEVCEELGRGSNNRVLRVRLGDDSYALRVPRRGSDTQQRASSVWEFRHTLKASQLGVGPRVYDAWHAKHARDARWPSGLYVLSELFEHDLDAVFHDADRRVIAMDHRAALGDAVVGCLSRLAHELVFVYDLKPSNVMVRFDGHGGVDVRVIDFGRDFCEWAGCETDPESRTPIVTMVRKTIAERELVDDAASEAALVRHILFAAMLVQFAATTTVQLFRDRRSHRVEASGRATLNVIAERARALLDSMRACDVSVLRSVLRSDEVRGVLRHYHGRRNSGTRRTLRYARGVER